MPYKLMTMLVALLMAAPLELRAADVDSVLARSKAASGGARWDSVHTLQLAGEKAARGLTGPWQSRQDLANGRYEESVRLGEFDLAEGYDGRMAWRRDVGGETSVLDGAVARRYARTQAWLTARGYWHRQRFPATYRSLPVRAIAERRYDVIEATPEGGNATELWFDQESGLLARVVAPFSGGSSTYVMATHALEDYREAEGLRLPHRIVTSLRNSAGLGDPNQDSELRIRRYASGPVSTDADFAPPPMPLDARIDNDSGTTRVPFDLVNNHVYVDAAVDGKPARFLVDTGAINLVTPAAAKRLGLVSTGRFGVQGAGANTAEVAFAKARSLQVGEAIVTAPVFYVIDLGQQINSMGVPYDGYIGYEVFRRFATTFDYAGRVLSLFEPARYAPPSGAVALKFEQDLRAPIVTGSLDGVPARVFVDSGSRGSLSLNSPFVRAHELLDKYRANDEAVLGWGIGGPAYARPVRLGTFELAGIQIKHLAGDLSTTDKGALASPDFDALMGGGLLRRFTVGLNYETKLMYLRPNDENDQAEAFDRSGLWLQADAGKIRIANVASDSAGARAKLRENDILLSVDGVPASSRTLAGWREQFRQLPADTRLKIEVVRDGAAEETELVLADRIPPRWQND